MSSDRVIKFEWVLHQTDNAAGTAGNGFAPHDNQRPTTLWCQFSRLVAWYPVSWLQARHLLPMPHGVACTIQLSLRAPKAASQPAVQQTAPLWQTPLSQYVPASIQVTLLLSAAPLLRCAQPPALDSAAAATADEAGSFMDVYVLEHALLRSRCHSFRAAV